MQTQNAQLAEPQTETNPLIVKGVAVRTGPKFASVSIVPEDGGRPGKLVAIRADSHQTMKIAGKLNHGIAFTGEVMNREPKVGDSVYIQIPNLNAQEAVAWACTDESVTVRPQIIQVPTKSKKTRPFAVKLAERRLKMNGVTNVEVVAVSMSRH